MGKEVAGLPLASNDSVLLALEPPNSAKAEGHTDQEARITEKPLLATSLETLETQAGELKTTLYRPLPVKQKLAKTAHRYTLNHIGRLAVCRDAQKKPMSLKVL